VIAEEVGVALAQLGAVVVCGGLMGVMAAANHWVDVVIPAGLGEARNALVVRSAAAVIAVDGEYGTLSEVALALRSGTPVIGISTWTLVRPDGKVDTGILVMENPLEAAEAAVALAAR
jgi:uncharacterized protein (TIGR00725 family)